MAVLARAPAGAGGIVRAVRPLSFGESIVFGFANLGSSMVYQLFNFGAGLYLDHYPAVPVWLVGLLSQERSFFGAFVQPAVGAISDRTRTRLGRRRPFFIVGVALTALSLLFLGTFPPLVPMLLILAVNAFFLNVAVDPYLALMADIVPMGQRGRIGAVLGVFTFVGAAVTSIVGALLWDSSPPLVFTLVVVGLVLSWTVTTVGVKEPLAPPVSRVPIRIDAGAYVRDILGHRELTKYIGAAALYWLGTGGVIPYITRFGVHELGMSEGEAFGLALPALGGSVIGAIVAGIAADRVGKKPILAAALAFMGVGAAVAAQVQTPLQAYVALAVLGLANGAITALVVPLLVDLVPPSRAAEMTGLGSGIWSLSQPIGALLAGAIVAAGDSYRLAFVGAAAFVLFSFLTLLTVRAPHVHGVIPMAEATH